MTAKVLSTTFEHGHASSVQPCARLETKLETSLSNWKGAGLLQGGHCLGATVS